MLKIIKKLLTKCYKSVIIILQIEAVLLANERECFVKKCSLSSFKELENETF